MTAQKKKKKITLNLAGKKKKADALIKLVGVGRSYGKKNPFWALQDIDIEINKGEFVAIIGPSGSGKSTLMNIIGCLDKPSKGYYELTGINVSKYSDKELSNIRNKTIGFIFQQFNLIPRISVLDNVLTPVLYGSHADPVARAKEILTSLGLETKMNNRPNELSGGQKQRVAIARSLIMNPPMILADEPTGNLDSKSGEIVMGILKDLHKLGHTVIIVTHDLHIAQQTNRMIKIKDGRVEEDVTN